MSDDLISRKVVLNILTEARVKDSILCSPAFVEMLTQRIKKIPTAFDKEKVIEELNSERNLMYREDGTLMSARTQISIDRAVDIVEKGGIE